MLQALVARLDTLLGMRQCDLNRLDVAHGSVEKSLGDVIEMLDKSIADVKAQIKQTLDDDPDLHERSDLLNTIPGLGERTVPQLLAYIGRPERFNSVKALAVTPDRHEGTTTGTASDVCTRSAAKSRDATEGRPSERGVDRFHADDAPPRMHQPGALRRDR